MKISNHGHSFIFAKRKASISILGVMATYRVALSKGQWPECIFSNDSMCMNVPEVKECVHTYQYIIDLISEKKKEVSLEFLPAENDSLVMQMVSSGQADFSSYLLRLSPERLDWIGLEHAGPLFLARNEFLFKSGKNQNASLNLLSIFPLKVYRVNVKSVSNANSK